MQLHLDEISRTVARGAHAVLLLDRAGWHMTEYLNVPKNMTLIFLPSRAPELNPVENVWQYLRQTWLSNRVFDTYEAIIDAACEADADLDKAIMAVGDKMKGDRIKNRVTVYYLLAEHFGKLSMFVGPALLPERAKLSVEFPE
jgi:hypothetical protein